MKHNIICISLMALIALVVGIMHFAPTIKGGGTSANIPVYGRDLAYEAYCDSIWENDPDYYMDVLMETYKYTNYINTYGAWWPED